MKLPLSSVILTLVLSSTVRAGIQELYAVPPAPPIPVGADGKYTIVADGVRAQFIPYGASITNLFVNDTKNIERDIVLGYDNASYYAQDKTHPHLGGVPGRYANRIKNGTFSMKGQIYHVPTNENNGADTLHGGPNGWDYRQFEVVQYTRNIIVFKIVDKSGEMGFPGTVTAFITYGLTPNRWHIYMNATADADTPLMLTSHVYWNLDAFQNPSTATVMNHTLELPFSGQRIDVDSILVPTGLIIPNLRNSPNDFWTRPKQIGTSFNDPALVGNCGAGCTGYDNCYLINRAQYGSAYFQPLADGGPWYEADPVATFWSEWSGIQVAVFTDQDAYQLYSCNGQDGTMPLKKTQGLPGNVRPRTVPKYGCVVMEAQDYIDAINNPSWQRDPKVAVGPRDTQPWMFEAQYAFSTRPVAHSGPIQQPI